MVVVVWVVARAVVALAAAAMVVVVKVEATEGVRAAARAEGRQEVKAGTEEAARYSRTSLRETACSCRQRRRKGR